MSHSKSLAKRIERAKYPQGYPKISYQSLVEMLGTHDFQPGNVIQFGGAGTKYEVVNAVRVHKPQ